MVELDGRKSVLEPEADKGKALKKFINEKRVSRPSPV